MSYFSFIAIQSRKAIGVKFYYYTYHYLTSKVAYYKNFLFLNNKLTSTYLENDNKIKASPKAYFYRIKKTKFKFWVVLMVL